MSAELLREAAALMRSRAEAAISGIRWEVHGTSEVFATWTLGDVWVADTGPDYAEKAAGNADHIASWHPVVALAVADWLDATEEHVASHACEAECPPNGCRQVLAATNVALTYLGRDA